MSEAQPKIVSLHTGLIRQPYRFAVRKRISPRHVTFDVYRPRTLGDFVYELLSIFSAESPSFMEAIAKIDDNEFMGSKHKSRRYIADQKDLLYIGNPKLAEKYAREQDGYWFITNIGAKETRRFARMAAKAAGVPCGSISKVSL